MSAARNTRSTAANTQLPRINEPDDPIKDRETRAPLKELFREVAQPPLDEMEAAKANLASSQVELRRLERQMELADVRAETERNRQQISRMTAALAPRARREATPSSEAMHGGEFESRGLKLVNTPTLPRRPPALTPATTQIPTDFYSPKEMPKWKGWDATTLQTFLDGCENHFASYRGGGISDTMRVSFAARGLEAIAESRWSEHWRNLGSSLEDVISSITWQDFKKWCRCSVIDESSLYMMATKKILNLRQREGQSMREFIEKWQQVHRIYPKKMPTKIQVAMIYCSLLPAYQQATNIAAFPNTIDELWHVAVRVDTQQACSSSRQSSRRGYKRMIRRRARSGFTETGGN